MKRYFPILLLLALSVGFAVAQDPSGPPSTQAKKYTIENCLNPFDTARVIPTPAGYQYWFIAQKFLEDGLTVKMSVVAPRQATHPPHQHEGDEIFFVLEGTAQFYLDGKTTTGGAYASFYCPAGSKHGISNAGSTELKYLVIRKYPVN